MSARFFFNDTATTEIYTLSLHDALPICALRVRRGPGGPQRVLLAAPAGATHTRARERGRAPRPADPPSRRPRTGAPAGRSVITTGGPDARRPTARRNSRGAHAPETPGGRPDADHGMVPPAQRRPVPGERPAVPHHGRCPDR